MTNLLERLDRLRRGARRALVVRGLSWVVVFGFTAMLLAGWIDWYWHVEGNLRLTLGIAMLAGAGWLSWRLLVRPLMHALSNVELAIKIERRFPGFRDSLASTVQFQSEHTDPRLGSPELQRRVIAETMPQLESVDLDAVIEQRGVRRAASTAFAVSLLVLVVVGFNQTEAATAVRRMLFPYSAGEWDRDTELQLLDDKLEAIRHEPGQPFRRVQGDTFRVYVENLKGALPTDTILEVKDADGDVLREKLRRLVVRDKNGVVHRLGTVNLLLERGPMYFRAVGGDDREMNWHRLEVVPAPRVESIRVTLVPPVYSGRKEETLPPGVGHIRALVGTEVRIEANSRTALRFARLRVKSDPPREAKLYPDGRRFTATFRLTDYGNYSYWFDLKDRQGFNNPNAPRYDVRALRDRVPTVRVIRPPRNARVTKNAVVPVRVIAEDDLALRDVRIRYRFSVSPKDPYQSAPLKDHAKPFRWQMNRLEKITEKMQIRFHVEATDHFNLDKDGLPRQGTRPRHVGKSLTRTITIVSAAEKAAEIARNYGSLLDELSRIAKQQQQAYDDVSQLVLQLTKAKTLRADRDLPLLRRVERAQREINVRLSESGGVEQRARELIEELRDNRIDEPELQRRLSVITTEVAELRRRYLPKIEADLTVTRKNADDEIFDPQSDKAKSRAIKPAEQQSRLKTVQQGQSVVLETLNKLIADLREWRNWQNLSSDLDDLIKTQESLHRKSLILKSSTLGLRTSELKDQQKADLAKLAEGQRRIAARVDRFHKDIAGFMAALKENPERNPAAIQTLSEAAGYVRVQQIGMRMRELARQIDANQLGRGTAAQEKLIEELREIKAILENRGTSDLETLIKKQRAAERELAGLEKRQEELFKKTREAAAMTNRNQRREELRKLVKRQDELQKDVRQMAGRLRRLLAIRANNAARRAAQSMARSARSLPGEDWDRNGADQRETLEHLEQARRELAKTRAQAEEQRARELLERIAAELQGIVKREQNVIDGTIRLRTAYERAGKWSRGRMMTLDTLQEEQLALRAKTNSLAQKTLSAEVFSRVLRNVGELMQQAALDLAASRKTASSLGTAIETERAIKDHLVRLLTTLAPPAPPMKEGPDSPPGGNGKQPQRSELISRIKQLILLKLLQEDTLRQTVKLHRGRKPGATVSETLKKSIAKLAGEQSQLADYAGSIAPKNSRVLPDIRPKGNARINIQNEPPIVPDNGKADRTPPIADLQGRIAAEMRTAAGQLAGGDTGKDTQDRQRKVIKDLEELIERAQRKLAQSTSGAPKSVRTGKKTPSKTKKSKKGRKSKTPMGKSPNSKGKKSKGPDEGTLKSKQAKIAARAKRRSALIREFWGHLPERERQRLRNVTGDSYLPKYKSQIDRYFESLAED